MYQCANGRRKFRLRADCAELKIRTHLAEPTLPATFFQTTAEIEAQTVQPPRANVVVDISKTMVLVPSPAKGNSRKRKAAIALGGDPSPPTTKASSPRGPKAKKKNTGRPRPAIAANAVLVRGPRRRNGASLFELQMTANLALPLDDGVVEHLGSESPLRASQPSPWSEHADPL